MSKSQAKDAPHTTKQHFEFIAYAGSICAYLSVVISSEGDADLDPWGPAEDPHKLLDNRVDKWMRLIENLPASKKSCSTCNKAKELLNSIRKGLFELFPQSSDRTHGDDSEVDEETHSS
jgi:hypothetical protein